MIDVKDVRGELPAASSESVLADPSGRRWRLLRVISWLVAVMFVVWLLALGLAGLGLAPRQQFTLGTTRVGHDPSAIHRTPGAVHHHRA